MGFPDGSAGEESTYTPGDMGSVPGLGRSLGGGHGNPLQYCCWENPLRGGTWWATVHGILQARILEWVSMSSSKGSSQPRDRTHISHLSFFTTSITLEALAYSAIEIMVKKEKRKLLESQATEYINGV